MLPTSPHEVRHTEEPVYMQVLQAAHARALAMFLARPRLEAPDVARQIFQAPSVVTVWLEVGRLQQAHKQVLLCSPHTVR